jgi:hypothetical protein
MGILTVFPPFIIKRNHKTLCATPTRIPFVVKVLKGQDIKPVSAKIRRKPLS